MLESYLISVAIKSTAVLAAGLVFARFMRAQSAAVRHLVYLTSLASAAIVPLLALWPAQWSYLISVPAGLPAVSGVSHAGTNPANRPIIATRRRITLTSSMLCWPQSLAASRSS